VSASNQRAAKPNGHSNIARWRRDPIAFVEEVQHDPETGQPFRLYPEQKEFLKHAFELTRAGRMRYSELCFSAGKKSGKTGLGAMIVIFTAVCLAGTGGEIYLLANDLEQSQSRVFKAVVLILQASPLLKRSADISANKITLRATGTTIQAVANDYQGFAGANPTLNVYDESAYYTSENSRRLWDEGVPSPARTISFRLSVSTAGFDGEPSPLRDLYDRAMQHGEEIAPDLRRDGNLLCYWTHSLKAPWQLAHGWVDEMRRTMRPTQFRRLIQNEWTSSEAQFIDLDDWDRCVDPDLRPTLADSDLPVYGGLDCSVRGDFTALALCTFDYDRKAVRVVNHRVFKPAGGDISFAAVEALITEVYEKFDLQGVWYDVFQAESLAQRLRAVGVNMVGFPQTPQNLEAAASNLLTLVSERNVVSYPSDELRAAIGNCRSVETVRGFRISKIVGSRKIDLAAALSFAALATVREGAKPEPGIIVYYKQQAAQLAAEDETRLVNAKPLPPAEQLRMEEAERSVQDEANELLAIYEQGHAPSRICSHCHVTIPSGTTYVDAGSYQLHKACDLERRRLGHA
jgi:phage terminase large subunit-like protein